MPRLSLTMKEGTVGRWYKKEGDPVEKDEPIVEVISEKATYDVEAPTAGVLRKITVTEGTDVPVNAVLAFITEPNEPLTEPSLDATEPGNVTESEARMPASPAAKRLAREHGIDWVLVKGSGPEGRVSEEDVQRFLAESSGEQPKVKETIRLRGVRKTSAERVATSFRTAPHSTVVMEVNVSRALAVHGHAEVSHTSILVKATAQALADHPLINSTIEGDNIKVFEDVNIGVAVATQNGLVVPVIRRANTLRLGEIDVRLNQLTEKAKQEKLDKSEVSGGTFTITNLGMHGVEFFIPIINPPEAAILAVGRISDKPVVVDGKIEVKPMMMLSLSYDHRIIDGAPAARFLQRVKAIMEEMMSSES